MRVLVADKMEAEGLEGLRGLGCEVVFDPDCSADGLSGVIARVEPAVVVVRSTKVRAEALGASGQLRMVIRAGSGYDSIDTDAASAKGVAVCNCPGMNAVAVAELAMGLMIACDRRVPDQVADWRGGAWRKGEYAKARGLKGRTLGVVGVGNIGSELVARARAFGMPCVAWSAHMTPDRARALDATSGGTTREDLLAMVGRCDVLSVHVALTDATRGLCDGAFFAAMREGAVFINTSRGEVVDEAAMRRAVLERGIRCGLDVQAMQPAGKAADWDSPLVDLPGIYATHHVGASTEQAQMAVADEVVRIVGALKDNGSLVNLVNEPVGTTG